MMSDDRPFGDMEAGLKPHPLADLFPMLEEPKARIALGDDILANGLRDKIVTLDGMIIDGRNRYRAIVEMGVFDQHNPDWRSRPDLFVPFDQIVPPGTDPLAWVLSKNLHRRHLDTGQRATIAAKLANMRQGERTDLAAEDGEPSANSPKVSQDQAAELLNVSTRSVTSAAAVLDHGAPELVAAMESGAVTPSAAERIARLDEAEQRLQVKLNSDVARAEARAARKAAHQRAAHLPQMVKALPLIKFAAFTQSVLNLVRGLDLVSAESVVAFAEQHAIIVREGDGFVFTPEALAALGTLAAAERSKPPAGPVSSPLPPTPGINAPVEFTVGGLRKKHQARFGVRRNADESFAVSMSFEFPGVGWSGPPWGAFPTYEQAIATVAFRLCSHLANVAKGEGGVVTETTRAAALAGLEWFGRKLAGWGIVAQDYSAIDGSPLDEEAPATGAVGSTTEPDRRLGDKDGHQSKDDPKDVYDRAVVAAVDLRGKHSIETAEPILRAGVAAGIKRQKIADDIDHPLGTVAGWTARLKLTDPARLHEPDAALAERNRAKTGGVSP